MSKIYACGEQIQLVAGVHFELMQKDTIFQSKRSYDWLECKLNIYLNKFMKSLLQVKQHRTYW